MWETARSRTHRVVQQRSPAALPGNGKYVCIGIEIWDQAGAAVTREYRVGCAPIRRRILGCAVSPWPAFIGRTQSPRYVHSKLSRASDDSERSSVTMPAERSADSSLGTIPRNGVCHQIGMNAGGFREERAISTGVRPSVVWRACDHDIDVSAC